MDDDISLREILEAMLGDEAKRRLQFRGMTNETLLQLSDAELVERLANKKDLADTRKMVKSFVDYLNGEKPSAIHAKIFLTKFQHLNPRSRQRYAIRIKAFLKFCGVEFQYKVPIPKSLPAYIEDNAIEKLLASIDGKKTHKNSALRDRLLVELALKAGMRREELSNLAAGDIHEGFLMVIAGKGNKDRLIPLSDIMAKRLHDFTAGMEPNERVFKLTTGAISNKIRF